MLITLPTNYPILGAQGGKAPMNTIVASRETNTIRIDFSTYHTSINLSRPNLY